MITAGGQQKSGTVLKGEVVLTPANTPEEGLCYRTRDTLTPKHSLLTLTYVSEPISKILSLIWLSQQLSIPRRTKLGLGSACVGHI